MASSKTPAVCLQRDWVYKESHKQYIHTTGEFVILTYNILNEDLCLDTKGFGQDDTTNGQRHELLMQEIDNHNDADIICMQEENMQHVITDDKETMLSLTDSRRSFLFTLFQCRKTNHLIAIGNVHLTFDFFKRMDMVLLEVWFAINELIKFSDGLETPHILCGDFNQEPHHPGYQLLHDRCISNAMTKYLRSFHQISGDANKVLSLMDIFKDRLTHPSTSLRSAYEVILGHEVPFSSHEDSSGYYQTPKKDRPSDAVQMLFDAIPSHPKVYRTDPEAYGSEKYIATLDYTWFSSDTLRCNGVLKMVDEDSILPFHACPNPSFSSDHLLLKASLSFLTIS